MTAELLPVELGLLLARPTTRSPGRCRGCDSRGSCPGRTRRRAGPRRARTRHPRTCCGCRSGRSRSRGARGRSRCPGRAALSEASACSRAKGSVQIVSLVALDVDAVRARFSALRAPTALFDGSGGTQVPDSVIDAIAGYLRDSNANLGGAFGSSRRSDALVEHARLTAAAIPRLRARTRRFSART